MSVNEILMLLIVSGIAAIIVAAAWFAGQLIIAFVEYIAECIERRRF